MTVRACVVCGKLIPLSKSRCATHQAEQDRAYGTRQQRGYDAAYDRMRRVVLAEEQACAVCGAWFEEGDRVEVDHIVPLREGGTNERDNLRAVHARCNNPGRPKGGVG